MSRILLKDVSMEFTIYGASDKSLKSKVLSFSVGGNISRDDKGNPSIQALRKINVDLTDGDRVALIGHNGAGKSTLLRVMSGAYSPGRGVVDIQGKVSTLFHVSLGLDPSATGYENILLRGLILGFNKKDIEKLSGKIAEFSQLGPYLDMPVRTYSDGMKLRLAFAVSVNINPDILLMDEWINVGDEQFKIIAERKLRELVDTSSILVLATHDVNIARDICNKAILMSHGEILDFGPIDSIIESYHALES